MLDFDHTFSGAFLVIGRNKLSEKYGFFDTPTYFRSEIEKKSKKPLTISKMFFKYKP
jgi:hypothetical protein